LRNQTSSKIGSPLIKNFYGGPIINQPRGLNAFRVTQNLRKGQNGQAPFNAIVPNDKENLFSGVI
jgi:hypothetical protein